MPSNDIQANFPNIASKLVLAGGEIDQAWLQLLIALWNRTGGGEGISSANFAAQLEALTDRVEGLEDRELLLQAQVDTIQLSLNDLTVQVSNIPLPAPIPLEDLYARLDSLAALVSVAPADLEAQLNSLAAEVLAVRTVAMMALHTQRQEVFIDEQPAIIYPAISFSTGYFPAHPTIPVMRVNFP